MTSRIDWSEILRVQPALSQSLETLGEGAAAAGLEASLLELVKLRASQINGCTYCVNMHSRDARRLGERQERLDLVALWREAPGFGARERAALAWTEAVTMIARDGVPDAIYAEAKAHFSDAELVGLTAAMVAINGWNRLAVAFRLLPAIQIA